MFKIFKKKEEIDSRLKDLSSKYRDMIVAITNFTKSKDDLKDKTFVIITATEKAGSMDQGHVMAIGGSTKAIIESLVNAGKMNSEVAKILVTASSILIHGDEDLEELSNDFKKSDVASLLSKKNINEMSDEEIREYAKKITDKGFGGTD